jgi:hypothetical protein
LTESRQRAIIGRPSGNVPVMVGLGVGDGFMKLVRLVGIALLLLVLGLTGVNRVISGASAADVASSGAAATTVGDPAVGAPTHKPNALVDANSVFFGCAAGTVVGALVTALPPLVGWTFYAGALPAVMALVASSGVGCTVGLFGGVILSTFHWVAATIASAWAAVFG